MMISVESLCVTFANKTLLGPVSFNIDEGSTLVIMGETGAGKSLIAQAIMGTLPGELRATGRIFYRGRRIDDLELVERQRLWGRSLAMLPQEPWRALDPLMRSYKQVFEVHKCVRGLTKAAASQQSEQDFSVLNLEGAMNKRPMELSGGMSQRVAFAAAIAGGGDLLLADEPTKGLDFDTSNTTLSLLKKIPEGGGTLVVITHDINAARSVGGELLVLRDGEVVESGITRNVLAQPSHIYTKALVGADPAHWPQQVPSATGNSLLRCENLIVGRQNTALTSAINLSVAESSRLALVGPSGVGKTTLLDTIAGLVKPVSGRVVHEQIISATDIQKIYQDPPSAFAPHVSLEKSLNDVAKLHQVAWSTVESLLEKLGVSTALLHRVPSAVSGGELQRIAIARALLVKPKLLLADEPTSRLDPITQKQTMNILGELTLDNQTAVVLVTHDAAIAEKWAHSTLSLH